MNQTKEKAEILYLNMIKKYVLGELQIGESNTETISFNQVKEIIKNVELKYRPQLVGQKKNLRDVLALSDETIMQSLNKMAQESSNLTMCKPELLDHTEFLVRKIINENIPGDLLEAGTCRGGMCMMMKATLEALGDKSKTIYLSDSFMGLPDADPEKHLADAIWNDILKCIGSLACSLDFVRNHFAKAGLLDERIKFVPGWFDETLPSLAINSIALLRIDADWYHSTNSVLNFLYRKVSDGGFVVIDDYGLPTDCAQAVDNFRSQHGITSPIIKINEQAVYWVKEERQVKWNF
ncbi:MAG: class I SAM-dependent methyltransferase [Deltaproteobacteria bacterium]|nr:class I SAM-dependent methyltransferase [Deltaproteobacteria bacterium]